MAKTKTTETTLSVPAFVKTITDAERRKECTELIGIFKSASGFEAKMWGSAIIGFGSYHYVYDSGREGDAPLVGFSPRKSEFALYIANFEGKQELLEKLGKHKTGKGCVYVKKIADVDTAILKKLILKGLKYYQAKYRQ